MQYPLNRLYTRIASKARWRIEIVDKLRKPNTNYTVIPNEIFNLTDMSADSRFVYLYLLSRPDGWNVNSKNIQSICKCGRDKAYKLLNELKDSDLLSYQRLNDGGGVYTLHEITTSVFIASDKVASDKSAHIVSKERAVNTETNILCKKDFARWWQLYPKKKGKADALKAWMRLKPNPRMTNVLIADTEKRKQEEESWQRDNGQFIPLGATYLRGARWEDEITPVVTQAETMPKSNDELTGWAQEKRLREARPGESMAQYRQALTELYRNV